MALNFEMKGKRIGAQKANRKKLKDILQKTHLKEEDASSNYTNWRKFVRTVKNIVIPAYSVDRDNTG